LLRARYSWQHIVLWGSSPFHLRTSTGALLDLPSAFASAAHVIFCREILCTYDREAKVRNCSDAISDVNTTILENGETLIVYFSFEK